MIGDPALVVGTETGAGDDVEVILGEAGNGEIAFDAAARIEHLRIGEASRLLGDIVGADP